MSYQALYRKYRPSELQDVVGQNYIVKIIKNSVKFQSVNHAYMFSGPRGTGKTTLAKILAKNVNCLEPINGEACGKCKNCLVIQNNETSDIIEIDAASNNGVDEIREIRNNVNLVPSELKYKVYIIDEVHMLSLGAFNALLKTLEEPPEHIIFVLATTDLHKVPVTIISRCQCFDFHRFTENEILERLNYIVSKENVDVEKGVLESIANLSDGGMRDAIGMLDKVVSYSDDNRVLLSDFEELNGIVSKAKKESFLTYIHNQEISKILVFIDEIYNNGKDLIIFTQDLLIISRDIIMDYYLNSNKNIDVDFYLCLVESLNDSLVILKQSSNVKIMFETKLLSFINSYFKNSKKLPENGSSTVGIEQKLSNDTNKNEEEINTNEFVDNSNILEDKVNSEREKINSIIVNNCFARAEKSELLKFKESWDNLNEYALDNQYGAVACYLVDGVLRAASQTEAIVTFEYESLINRGLKLIDKIELLFEKILNHPIKIALLTTEQWNLEKQKYIECKNNGTLYKYQDYPIYNEVAEQKNEVIDSKNETITDTAISLFGKDIVSSE
ncbi:MAG: DNA polymerase III subunit gamma/tau [Firmicutes bacterium]|nr:DNA polymerase III subunit gamma/tau [Bacillota bacterium]